MKYRVSLLPEQSRKRLNSKKKLEKIKIYSLVVLIILALFTFVVMLTSFIAEKKLAEARQLDNEYAQKVAELEHFREINATLQNKVQLIESIQVEEPQLVNFIATIANLKPVGISIDSIECTDWKVTRNCVLVGSCYERQQYLDFEEALKGVEGISAVSCTSYSQDVDGKVTFTVNVACVGGKAPVVETTEATTGTSTDGETTQADTTAAE